MSAIQFPLQFEFQANKGFETFYSGCNKPIVTTLKNLVVGSGDAHIFLYGGIGYGKSHLLQACCQLAFQQEINSFYYSFKARALPNSGIFEGLEQVKLVCFDNIDAIAGHLDLEQEFLNFLNQHLTNNYRWILSARQNPENIAIKLPDLKQHLNLGTLLKLNDFANEDSVAALIYKASYMGITITPKVGNFLINHYVSDLASLCILLGQLDKATLSAQRKLTIPFLKQILEE